MLANSRIPLGQWSGSDATKALHQSINEFNEVTSKQTRTIIRLTWAILFLTAVMSVAVILQLVKAV